MCRATAYSFRSFIYFQAPLAPLRRSLDPSCATTSRLFPQSAILRCLAGRTLGMMDGGTANAASAAHSTPGSHPGPVMNTAQGSDKMPSQTQTPDMPMAARMLEVYFHQPDGPYYAGVRTQRQNQVPLGNVPGLSSAFQHYRTTYVPPSESSIVSPSNATDSGYMSAPRHSVGIPSTYGGDLDHFTDTQSMTGRLEEVVLFPSNLPSFPVDHGSQPNANINSWAQDGERPMPSNTNNQAPETTHACSTCGQGFRTPSDLK